MIRCSDDSLYTGITLDIERRVKEHNEGKKGAKAIKGKRPIRLVYKETVETRSEALKKEYEIKKLKRQEKLELFNKESLAQPRLNRGQLR